MALFALVSSSAHAHFGMIIPSDSMVMQGEDRNVQITLSFSHPFEVVGMDLEKPAAFGVMINGKSENLLGVLQSATVMDHMAWKAYYRVKHPGVYMFYMEPKPYWEPAEDCFIVHYTKTVVAFHEDEGWDTEIGLKTEIVPLTKPYGLYAGNLFQGIALLEPSFGNRLSPGFAVGTHIELIILDVPIGVFVLSRQIGKAFELHFPAQVDDHVMRMAFTHRRPGGTPDSGGIVINHIGCRVPGLFAADGNHLGFRHGGGFFQHGLDLVNPNRGLGGECR